jgi:putative nucleotidyltransferase with HDIG domain
LLISSDIEALQKKLADIRESDYSPSEEEIIVLLDLADIMNKTNPHEACYLAEQALSIIRELEIEVHYARCYKIQGVSHAHKGDYEKALEYSLKALAIYEDTNDSTALSSTLNTIGIIYRNRKDFKKALEYYTRSLEIREKTGNKKGIATTTNNIGILYHDINEYEKALKFAEKSLASFTELEDDLGIATSYNNMGTLLKSQGNLDTAQEYYMKAYEIFKRIGYNTGYSAACNNLGEILTFKGEFNQSELYLNDALNTAIEIGVRDRELTAYKNLSTLYAEKDDYKEALRYYRKYSELSQKVFSEESTRNMVQLQIRFETERKKKEAEIYRLKNIELQNEITERIHIEDELRKHQNQLEEMINERTVELIKSFNKLERGFQGTIVLVSKITELRDPYTSGHQIRVAKLASAIAREMKLPEEKVEAIHIASLVHDIGKINVPQEILSKPGILSDLEMRMIQIHPQTGCDILSEINFPWPIAEIVREHHEHINGSGYPQGLKADSIMIEARIICVADVIEAMSSHRPYRPILGLEEAVREITDNMDVLYDGDVVKACRKVIVDRGFNFD